MHLPRTTVIQRPLARALSHCGHWREAKGSMWWHDGAVTYSEDVSFETFASDPMIVNYQSRQLGDLSFQTIGVVGKLTGFLEDIGLDASVTVPYLNTSLGHEMPSIDHGFMYEFVEMNTKDYELFTTASQCYED